MLTLVLAIALISLTGIPPTVGFWSKIYIFNAGIRADLAWLVIIGVLNSVVAAYYYLGVARQMFLGGDDDEGAAESISTAPALGVALAVAAAGVVVFGIIPQPLIDAARDAAELFAS